jgi:hypothetical protein
MKLLLPLAHYHTIYLIVELLRINLMFNGLKITLPLIKSFINIPSIALRNSNILATP